MTDEIDVTAQAGDEAGEQAATATATDGATEKEAPATEASAASEQDAAQAEGPDEHQRLLNKFDKERKIAQRKERETALENARLRGQLDAMQKPKGDTEKAAEAQMADEFERINPAPKEDDFKTFAEFITAKTRHEIQRERWLDVKQKENIEQNARREEIREQGKKIKEQGMKKYPEFDQVNFPVGGNMIEEIHASPVAVDILWYLHNNRDDAARIAALSPERQAREIGRLEARIEDGKLVTLKTSKAPAPPATLRGGGTATVDPDKMPIDQWMRMEQERDRKRRYGG